MTKTNESSVGVLSEEDHLARIGVEPFEPWRDLRNPHVQTIAALYLPNPYRDLSGFFHKIALPDDDVLIAIENVPSGWKKGGRVAVLTHGLTGCYNSHYMSRIAGKLLERGVAVYRINQRGCGPGLAHAVMPPHSGRSEDFRVVLDWLAERAPGSPISLLGFSLGANLALKMVGEDGNDVPEALDSVVAVSPPIDLAASSEKISSRKNWHYDFYFSRRIKSIVKSILELNPDLNREGLPKRVRLKEIDELYTAPHSGFRDAADYYAQCSAAPLIDRIRVPTLILASLDDPVVDTVAYREIPKTSYVDTVLTERGGHVGFLSSPFRTRGNKQTRSLRWMDDVVLSWLECETNGADSRRIAIPG